MGPILWSVDREIRETGSALGDEGRVTVSRSLRVAPLGNKADSDLGVSMS